MAAYVSGQVSIGTTPTAIVTPTSLTVLVSNGSGAAVFLGGPNVSTSNGYQVALSTSNVQVPVAGDGTATLYGVVASTATTVSYVCVV